MLMFWLQASAVRVLGVFVQYECLAEVYIHTRTCTCIYACATNY